MENRIKRNLLFIFFVLGVTNIYAQDIHFSQFNMAPLNLNPAMAGSVKNREANINYKNQWKSVTSPYQTYAAAYHARITKSIKDKGYSAYGISFFNDKAGDASYGSMSGNINLAHHVKLNTYTFLGGGMMLGFGQKTINSNAFQTGSQYSNGSYNASLPSGESNVKSSKLYFDSGIGLVFNHDNSIGKHFNSGDDDFKINGGIAWFHMNRPGISFLNNTDKLSMKFVSHINSSFSIKGTNVAFMPSVLAQFQGPANEYVFGSMFRYKLKQESKFTGWIKGYSFAFGGFYRMKDAVMLAVKFDYDRFSLGFSYDLNVSNLTIASKTRGGMEISLRYVDPSPFPSKR